MVNSVAEKVFKRFPLPFTAAARARRQKLTVKRVLVYLFNCYLCFVLAGLFVVFGVKDRLALFPMQNTEWRDYLPEMGPKLGVQTKDFFIAGPNGQKIAALLITKPGAKYIYLVSHGNGGNLGYRIMLAAYLISTGQSVLLYDYEGYGESTGEAKLVNLVPDGLCAYDYLVKTAKYKPEQIILYGESIGTGVTGGIMKARPYGAVILQSGFPSLLQAARDRLWQLRIFPDWLMPEPHFDTLSVIKAKHPPLLLIHGTEDTTLSVNYSRLMFAEASAPKQYYEIVGAGHNDIGQTDVAGFRKHVSDFIAGLDAGSNNAR